MAWFKKKGGEEDNRRQEDRFEATGETVNFLLTDGSPGVEFTLTDISVGGFRVDKYQGPLTGGQYFEMRFVGELDGKKVTFDAFATCVRVTEVFMAAQFTPQPKVKTFLRDYLARK